MAHCRDCEMDFSNTSNFRNHIKRKHPGKVDILAPKIRRSSTSRMHVCNECSKTFVSFSNLRFHVKKKHSDKLEELAPLEVKTFKCLRCDAEFQMLKSLIEHNRSHIIPATLQCPLCEYTGASIDVLIMHYKVDHSLEINNETLEFKSFEAFQHWKSTIEKESFASFIKVRGTTKNKNYMKIDYKCHRSGEYKTTGKKIRKLKTQGSNKMGGFCPAKISVIIRDNKCKVQFCGNHVGHQQERDIEHLYLTSTERANIAAKIAAKIPLQSILDEIRDVVSDCPLERLHLLKKKDLYNIKNSLKLSGSSVRPQNDDVSVEAWINELKSSNSVLFYKPQDNICSQFPNLNSEDFILIIMTEGQKELLINFGQDCICVDRTHGRNGYGELHTIFVLDDLREGYPCAFLISNRSDTEVFKIFFSCVEDTIQEKIRPRVFMSDMAEAYYNAWLDVMHPAEFRLFCSWDVDKAWRRNLDKIKNDTEKKALIYRMMRMLLEERDICAFENSLSKFVKFCTESPDTAEFGKYFQGHYANIPERWAYCFRLDRGLNSNMHVERMHRTIKHLYLDGKFVRRFDKAIGAIMKFVRNKLFERLGVLHKGISSTKINDLRQRHKSSESLDVSKVTESSEMSWIVPSSSSKETYIIEELKTDCDCKITCNECNSCIHRYTCTCMDSCFHWNMCKHIHLVCSYIRSLPEADQDEAVLSESDIVIVVGRNDAEIEALLESVSTEKPPIQCALEEQIVQEEQIAQQQQDILQEFQGLLFGAKSLEEIAVFKRVLARVKPSLAAVRNQQKSSCIPVTSNTLFSNKCIEP